MIDYRAGIWGFHVAFGWHGSLAPRALTMAVPNALITYVVARFLLDPEYHEFNDEDIQQAAGAVLSACTVVMSFILYNRSRTSYSRWWEGGTLLQKTRGEWFNAYSSIMAFTSTKPEMADQVEAYVNLLARLMSLLMCCGLQQVSPNRDRPFEIIDLNGIEPASMDFLNSAPDKVEIILQWIQRSMVLHQQTGVLPVAPPILSRAFQEVSRGIVNLQNARKIADFPYPFPLAQICMILQMAHWAMTPFAAALALPLAWAVALSFCSIFVLWCIHFNALDLEFPFGARVNDLPMHEMQPDWNNSICTLLQDRASRPPLFNYRPEVHAELTMAMSDASELYIPSRSKDAAARRNCARIAIKEKFGPEKAKEKAVAGEGREGSVTLSNASSTDPQVIATPMQSQLAATESPKCVAEEPSIASKVDREPAVAPRSLPLDVSATKQEGIGSGTAMPSQSLHSGDIDQLLASTVNAYVDASNHNCSDDVQDCGSPAADVEPTIHVTPGRSRKAGPRGAAADSILQPAQTGSSASLDGSILEPDSIAMDDSTLQPDSSARGDSILQQGSSPPQEVINADLAVALTNTARDDGSNARYSSVRW